MPLGGKLPYGNSKKKRPSPVGRAGNYAAPVDTAGMDPEMKASLGFPGGERTSAALPARMAAVANKPSDSLLTESQRREAESGARYQRFMAGVDSMVAARRRARGK